MGMRWSSYPWWLGLALCAAMACGDDADAPKSDEPMGEPCPAAGIWETGCKCTDLQPLGSRQCLEDKVWSECRCAAARDESACPAGQNVRCDVCPGEAVGRLVECAQDGTYDCSCPMPDASAPLDAGAQPDAATPPASDAG